MNTLLSKIRTDFHIVWLLVLVSVPQSSYAQSKATYYDSIINTTIKDSLKILTIESWVPTVSKKLDPLELNEVYSNFSKFCYRKKQFEKAIFNANQALDIQLTYIDTLPQLVNKTYNNLSVFYRKAGNLQDAFQTLKKLTALNYKDKYTVIAYINGLKDHAIQRGDYYQALSYIQEAEEIIRTTKNESLHQEYYRIPIAYSSVYLKLGGKEHYDKALNELKKADSLNVALTIKKKQVQNHIIIHNRFGQIYSKLKDYDKAIYHFEEALNTNLKLQKTTYQIAILLNNLGVNYYKKGMPEKALLAYNKAVEYESRYTATYDNLGDYYLNENKYELALLHYQKAIDYNLKIYENHDFHKLAKKEAFENSAMKTELLNDLKDKSKAWLAFYKTSHQPTHLKNALSTIEMADYLVDLIRLESTEPKSRFFWRAKEIDLYMLATSIAYELKNQEKALYFMEKSKSLALLENLTHEEAKKRANLPDSLINKEYELKKHIFTTRQQLENEHSITDNEKKHTIYKIKKTYNDFINSLEKKYPNYYQYKKEITIVEYNDVVKSAKETKSSFLQYIVADNKGYGILITPVNFYFFEIENPTKLHQEIITIGNLLNEYWKTKEDQKRFTNTSQSIYHKLLPFDISQIKDISENLVIIPDHTLQYIPFEVLISSVKNAPKVNYLLQDFDISYLYSISLHKQVAQKKHKAPNFFLGMAPINFEYLDLPKLSLSKPKIKNFQKKLGADILIKEKASKANFIKNANNYQILHLSSHASSLEKETPWIAFSDEKLTLNELYFIPNSADIVILDACKTGIGKLQPGEGTLSLTRGFFHSGAKSVVSSLWNTNEKSSNEIITNFYTYLKKGVSKSKALRMAKLDFLSSHQGSEKSPYYWGALILTGDNSSLPIITNQWSYWKIFIAITTALLLLLLFIKKYHPTIKNNSRVIHNLRQ